MHESVAQLDETSLGAERSATRPRASLAFRFCKLFSPAVAVDLALLLNAVDHLRARRADPGRLLPVRL